MLLDPDRFGYLSLHYVVGLPLSRLELTEYKPFGSHKAEIQIRSVLQHAWAEIEHDLGYQSKIAIPGEMRRRFSRIARILELVDQEFIGLRNDIVGYSETVKTKIAATPELVEINNTSLAVYLFHSSIANRIDKAISKIIGVKLIDQPRSDFDEALVKTCLSVGIKTIDELDRALIDNEQLIKEFSREYDREYPIGQKDARHLLRSGGIYYLSLVLVSKTKDVRRIKEYVHSHSQFQRFEKREGFADFLQRTLLIASDRIAAAEG